MTVQEYDDRRRLPSVDRLLVDPTLVAAVAEQGRAVVSGAVGGGSLPGEVLPGVAVAISSSVGSPDELAHKLRTGQPSVVGRIAENELLLDVRTVRPDEDELLLAAVLAACSKPTTGKGEAVSYA